MLRFIGLQTSVYSLSDLLCLKFFKKVLHEKLMFDYLLPGMAVRCNGHTIRHINDVIDIDILPFLNAQELCKVKRVGHTWCDLAGQPWLLRDRSSGFWAPIFHCHKASKTKQRLSRHALPVGKYVDDPLFSECVESQDKYKKSIYKELKESSLFSDAVVEQLFEACCKPPEGILFLEHKDTKQVEAACKVIAAALQRPIYTMDHQLFPISKNVLIGSSVRDAGSHLGEFSKTLVDTGCMNPVVDLGSLFRIRNDYMPYHEEALGILGYFFHPWVRRAFPDKFLLELSLDFRRVFFIAGVESTANLAPFYQNNATIISIEELE
jgi:hypothetical protein